jgi:hypothetical protein
MVGDEGTEDRIQTVIWQGNGRNVREEHVVSWIPADEPVKLLRIIV